MLYLNCRTYYKVNSQILEILDQYYLNFYIHNTKTFIFIYLVYYNERL